MTDVAPGRRSSWEWVAAGTGLWESTLASVEDQALRAPSLLPGWSRAHVVAHVALNARALGHLVTWARTGVETPMYASPQARDADIEELAGAPAQVLRVRSREEAQALAQGMGQLGAEQWQVRVRVRQGTAIAADTIPWLRAREVFLHALDLGAGACDQDLPVAFAHALLGDVSRQRSRVEGHPSLVLREEDGRARWEVGRPGPGAPQVVGDVRALAAWVTGRPVTLPVAATGGGLPQLPPWL
ncbi:maleylpyruvate isomerase family mycothiol-dependent enzyme [uncultured Serinicoccus sp.]|uniref:maleylpyruvate isomerase family mycothiol-dependent enzyme n=1 Tax=uncultured Serinicoccus sp. TaxID=735514 RepID=UPI0026027DB7|nr:maleylpyruvate isomerase family mycothiol-dependent enzyme [uncultured Serinicoccus sp.]